MSAEKHEYGPVTEYHGTIDLPKVLSEGIRGGNPKTRSNRYVPEGMREEDLISYTHPDREMALAYAQDRANRMKLDPKKVGVVGVRGTQLPEAVEHQEPKEGIFGGTNSLVRPGSISPEYLIQASEDKMKPKKKKGVVLIISVGPKMPRKPTDEATPNKEVKKAIPEWDEQVDVNNNTSLRILPREFLSRATNPVPVPSARQVATDPTIRNEPGSTFRWEEELQEAHNKNPDYGYLPLPGFAEQDFGGQQISGTWVAPSDLRSFVNPDFSFGFNKPSNYLLVNDTPNFYRTQHENIKGAKSVPEGFQYADEHGKAFDPEDFYTLPFPPDASVKDIERVALNMSMGDTLSENAPSKLKEIEKLLERLNLSNAGGYQKWVENKRRPTNTQEAKDMGILNRKNDRIITGEPMEIAYQLLKDIYNLSSPEMEGHKNDYEEYFNKVVLPQAKDEEHAKRLKFAFNNLQNFYLPYSYQYNEGSSHRDRYDEKDEERRGVYRNLSRLGYGDYGDAWHKTKSSSRGSTHPREYQEQNDVLEQLEEEKLLENTKPENWRSQLPKTERQRDYLKLPLEAHLEGNLENYAHWLSPSEKQKKLLSASAIGQMTSQGPLAELEYQRQFSDLPLINSVTPTSQLESERVFNELKDDTLFNVGEPMKIAYRLLKRNLSPAARKHKLEYDTKYQSSPKRVKYRVELNRERRRRGIYGSGNGKDVSHTEGGKLTLENEHDNRARHFRNRGTLRKVKVKK